MFTISPFKSVCNYIWYNVNIIYYLPILWAISSFIFLQNFVRSRIFLQQHLNHIFCCQKRTIKTNDINPLNECDIIVNVMNDKEINQTIDEY